MLEIQYSWTSPTVVRHCVRLIYFPVFATFRRKKLLLSESDNIFQAFWKQKLWYRCYMTTVPRLKFRTFTNNYILGPIIAQLIVRQNWNSSPQTSDKNKSDTEPLSWNPHLFAQMFCVVVFYSNDVVNESDQELSLLRPIQIILPRNLNQSTYHYSKV